MISTRQAKHVEATAVFTYSHANTYLDQSEGAYYLSYVIIVRAGNLSRQFWNYGIILFAININQIFNLKQIYIMEPQYLQISLLLLN